MLKAVSAARLTLRNPPAVMTSRRRASPACPPSAAPTSCDSEVAMQPDRMACSGVGSPSGSEASMLSLVGSDRRLSNKCPSERKLGAFPFSSSTARRGPLLTNEQARHLLSTQPAELRSVILKARAVALENAEHHRAAEAFNQRLLAELNRHPAGR